MADFEIEMRGLEGILSALRSYNSRYSGEMRRFFREAGFLVQHEAQVRTPHGYVSTVGGEMRSSLILEGMSRARASRLVKGSTGNLMRSMATLVDRSNPPTYAEVGSKQPYAHFIEEGWRERKRGTGKIVHRSLGPAHMLHDGARAAMGRVQQSLAATIARLLAGMRGR